MHHRSHDREALAESRQEPGSVQEPGSLDSDSERQTARHEAANWLAVVVGHLELLSTSAGQDPKRVAAALAAARKAGQAVRGVLDAPTGIFDLADLAAAVAEDCRAFAPAAIRVDNHLWADRPAGVDADQEAVRDALLNLIRNAIEAIGSKPGRVEIVVRVEGPLVLLSVEDDGPGMSAESLERCMQFGSSTKGGVGRGIGLARVAQVCERSGVEVDVSSELGHGTRFELRFHAAPAGTTQRTVADHDAPQPGTATVEGVRVLVVEDDVDVSEVEGEMLRRLGARPIVVESASRARVELATGEFDLVLIDLDLIDARGDALAFEVRQNDPALAIVLVTGAPGAVEASESRGIDLVASKPLGLDALKNLLDFGRSLTRRRRGPGHARGATA